MSNSPDRPSSIRLNRRTLTIGAAGAALSGTGVVAAADHHGGPGNPVRRQDQPTATVISSAPPSSVPDGYALVASPRLPLWDLASQDVGGIVSGQIPSWIEVGSAVDMPITPVALEGSSLDGLNPTKTYKSYERLATFLNSPDGYGGVALVPADQVDARVNVLAVDGFDPVRMGQFDEPVFRIGYVGDIVPGRNVGIKMQQYNDYTHPFHRVADLLASYDLTVANLEGNLSDTIEAPADPNTFSFISPTAMLDGFEMAGIDVVSLANNHSVWNDSGWGTSALIDTLDACQARGIVTIGAGTNLENARFAYTGTFGGKTVALIGIDGVTANINEQPYGAT
ncbi:MAG TPA: CapA family protein, partial [Thermomicrobiales bacterium]|nr:CapA family protein [Thermomicrobiales bacterium]